MKIIVTIGSMITLQYVASDGNNENLVQEHCPFIKMRRIEKDKGIAADDNDGGCYYI